MCYWVKVDHNGVAVHLTRSDWRVFKMRCMSIAVDKTNDDTLWIGSKQDVDVRGECEEG